MHWTLVYGFKPINQAHGPRAAKCILLAQVASPLPHVSIVFNNQVAYLASLYRTHLQVTLMHHVVLLCVRHHIYALYAAQLEAPLSPALARRMSTVSAWARTSRNLTQTCRDLADAQSTSFMS